MKAFYALYKIDGGRSQVYLEIDEEATGKLRALWNIGEGEELRVNAEMHSDRITLVRHSEGLAKLGTRSATTGRRRFSFTDARVARLAHMPESRMTQTEIMFESGNHISFLVPKNPVTPLRRRTIKPSKKSEPKVSTALVMIGLPGRTLEFNVPIGHATDIAIDLGEFKVKAS